MKSGYTLVLLAGCCWGLTGLFMKNLNNIGSSPEMTSFIRIAISLVMIAVMVFAMQGKDGFKINKAGVILSFFSGVLCLAVFNLCHNYSVIEVGAARAPSVSKVPIIASFEIVVAACVGFIFLKEPFGMLKLVGIILVLASIVISNMERPGEDVPDGQTQMEKNSR